LANSLDSSRGKKAVSVKARSQHQLSFGTTDIDLGAVEQLVETNQTKAIAKALISLQQQLCSQQSPPKMAIADLLAMIDHQLQTGGIGSLSDHAGDLAQFRPIELAAALNRLRGLQVHITSVINH
jgi:hypothetical protein